MNITIKIILGIVIISLSIYSGYKLSSKFKIRYDFFSDYYNFNQKMIEEVNFRKNSIINVIEKFSCKEHFKNLLLNYKQYLSTNHFEPPLYFLSENEKEDVVLYFTNLGKNDTKNELNSLKSYENKLKEIKNCTEIENKKYKTLYLKLSFLFGLLIFILII